MTCEQLLEELKLSGEIDEEMIYDHFMRCKLCQHKMVHCEKREDHVDRESFIKLADIILRRKPHRIGKSMPIACRLFQVTWLSTEETVSEELLAPFTGHFKNCVTCRKAFLRQWDNVNTKEYLDLETLGILERTIEQVKETL